MVFILPIIGLAVVVALEVAHVQEKLTPSEALNTAWLSIGLLALWGLGSIASSLAEIRDKIPDRPEN